VKRYLLDTGAASDTVFRRLSVNDRVKEAKAAGHRIGIGLPVLDKLYAGVEYSKTRDRNFEILRRNLRLFTLWPFPPEAAQVYGRLYAELRRKGRTIQQVDLQIAAIALYLGNCTVVSKDSDLSAVPGLSVENWATA
jgi:tRNA(fMet)-specific endonuclease VapC